MFFGLLRIAFAIMPQMFIRHWTIFGIPFFFACGMALSRHSFGPLLIGVGVSALLVVVSSIVHVFTKFPNG
jgi:hypothetical protein